MHEHDWAVFSTLRMDSSAFLIVHCSCGNVGVVSSVTNSEWDNASRHLPETYPWNDTGRVMPFPGMTTGWNEESRAWVLVRG